MLAGAGPASRGTSQVCPFSRLARSEPARLLRRAAIAAMLMACGLSPRLDAGTIYSIDDGTTEISLGITPAGAGMMWMNHFTAVAGGTRVLAIDLMFGRPVIGGSGMVNGKPLSIYLWSDPNGDGSPGDAQVLASATGLTGNVDLNIFNRYVIGPVSLAPGSSFFAGAIYLESGSQFPASIDTGSANHQSWYAGWLPGVTPATHDFGAAASNLNNLGNFVIRVEADAPEPGSWVPGLVGSLGLASRRLRRSLAARLL